MLNETTQQRRGIRWERRSSGQTELLKTTADVEQGLAAFGRPERPRERQWSWCAARAVTGCSGGEETGESGLALWNSEVSERRGRRPRKRAWANLT